MQVAQIGSTLPVQGPLAFEAPAHVRDALAAMGRTEDLAFSPDSRRIAIAEFARHRILLLDVAVEERLRAGRLLLTDCIELWSRDFLFPHGLCFLDEDTLVVANREAATQVYRLPPSGYHTGLQEVVPLQAIRGPWFRRNKTPGSVAASRAGPDVAEVLVCNNYQDTVTRHVLDRRRDYRVKSNHVRLSEGLSVPDGVVVSEDGRWIAISNHGTHAVLLFENTGRSGPQHGPAGVLRDVNCPHGLAFACDDRMLLVASAATPLIHVFSTDDAEDWRGERDAIATSRVMDDDTFLRGRTNPEEGGPKGLEVSAELNVLATTSEHQPLAFFELDAFLPRSG